MTDSITVSRITLTSSGFFSFSKNDWVIKEKLDENQARLNEVENQIQQVSKRYAYRNMTSEQVTSIMDGILTKIAASLGFAALIL